MELHFAQGIVQQLIGVLKPAVDRIEIAGSIRRVKPEVKDIELVCIPRPREKRPQFGKPLAMLDPLEARLAELVEQGVITHLTGGERMKKFCVGDSADGVKVDLFIVRPPAQWGVIFTIRTGPADFSHWIVTKKNDGGGCPDGLYVREGRVVDGDGMTIPTREEEDFLRVMELEWIDPAARRAMWR